MACAFGIHIPELMARPSTPRQPLMHQRGTGNAESPAENTILEGIAGSLVLKLRAVLWDSSHNTLHKITK
jgi:hypothetical protein